MAKESALRRKLAAIVAADVVGYSRMMEADEVGTLRRVQLVQKTCVTPILAAHGGRLIKTTGDGFLLEFSSAVEAVLFALDLQKKVQAAMAGVPEAMRLVLRVGIHAGDVLSDGHDMFGDGVNVAARLETLCAPGGISMSAVVREQLVGKLDVPLVDLGEHQVKNITRAIHVFGIEAAAIPTVTAAGQGAAAILRRPRLRLGLAAAAAALVLTIGAAALLHQRAATPPQTAQRPVPQTFSLAVMPFTSLNKDGASEDFADALVDNLTTALSIGLPASSVVSSASALTFRGKTIDPREAGRELGAKYLLFGSVQRFSDRLRVNVQLVDAQNAAQLWSDTFDGAPTDLRALQEQITSGIANTLSVQLVRIEADRQKDTSNASALDLIFRGSAILNRGTTRENMAAAEADFRRALALDASSLMAMKALGSLLTNEAALDLYHVTPKTLAAFDEGRTLLDRVREADARYPGINNALGFVALYADRRHEAIALFKAELEIDPSSTGALSGLALCLVGDGHAADAVPLLEKAMKLDPHGPGLFGYQQSLMLAYFALGKYPEAIEQGERVVNANPKAPDILFYLAAANALAGNDVEAKARLGEARKLDPTRTVGAMRKRISAKEASEVALANRYIDGLKRAGLPE